MQRRWDPYTAGRSAGALGSILNPTEATVEGMLEAIEDLETKRYGGTAHGGSQTADVEPSMTKSRCIL